MPMAKHTLLPKKGNDLPDGIPDPPFKLTVVERKWWDWMLVRVDRNLVGDADLLALAFLAREVAIGLKAGGAASTRLWARLEGFGLAPDGRKRLLRLVDASRPAAAPAGGYDEFE